MNAGPKIRMSVVHRYPHFADSISSP
jgi:hypothetical protein